MRRFEHKAPQSTTARTSVPFEDDGLTAASLATASSTSLALAAPWPNTGATTGCACVCVGACGCVYVCVDIGGNQGMGQGNQSEPSPDSPGSPTEGGPMRERMTGKRTSPLKRPNRIADAYIRK